jgi:NAD(P)-dependent dehydrogenase (short-subunit alcohol dehydrogenase family)
LVTGSTSGIGRATELALARAGAFAVVTGRDEMRGKEICEETRAAGGRAALVPADLTDPDAVSDLARRAPAKAGGQIDILVNNAGDGFYAPTEGISLETFEALFAVNTRAPFHLTAALAPAMAQRGHGVVVNVTGTAADLGVAALSVFGGAKAALASMR